MAQNRTKIVQITVAPKIHLGGINGSMQGTSQAEIYGLAENGAVYLWDSINAIWRFNSHSGIVVKENYHPE